MPTYIGKTKEGEPEETRFAQILLPSRLFVLGSVGNNGNVDSYTIARCHPHDLCTHILHITDAVSLEILGDELINGSGEPVDFRTGEVLMQIEDGEHATVDTYVEAPDTGMLVPNGQLRVEHSLIFSST